MEMIIAVGLQASGKSSFCRQFAPTHTIVSKDLFPNAKKPQKRQMREIQMALDGGRSIVVDNTNPAVEDREPLIKAARAAGARVIGYVFNSTVAESLELNRRRDGNARVPDVAILSTVKRFILPSMAEGFDRLYQVRFENGGFLVSE
jgi:predicted kinase